MVGHIFGGRAMKIWNWICVGVVLVVGGCAGAGKSAERWQMGEEGRREVAGVVRVRAVKLLPTREIMSVAAPIVGGFWVWGAEVELDREQREEFVALVLSEKSYVPAGKSLGGGDFRPLVAFLVGEGKGRVVVLVSFESAEWRMVFPNGREVTMDCAGVEEKLWSLARAVFPGDADLMRVGKAVGR